MTPTHSLRWLIGSVVLNIFLIGLIVGALTLNGRHRGPPMGQGMRPGMMGNPLMGFERIKSELSPEGQQKVQAFFSEKQSGMQQHFEAFRQQRQSLETVMAAEPFDAAAAEKAFAELRAQENLAAQAVQARLVTLAQSLNAADRRALAEGMKRLPMPPGPMPRGAPGP